MEAPFRVNYDVPNKHKKHPGCSRRRCSRWTRKPDWLPAAVAGFRIPGTPLISEVMVPQYQTLMKNSVR